MDADPAAVGAGRTPLPLLLRRIRSLVRLLAGLLLVVEVVEWVDAELPVWPDRTIAAVALAGAAVWIGALHRSGRATWFSDLGIALCIVVSGWGLGRPGATLALLLGATLLRVLYGSRRSAAAGVAGNLVGYATIGALHGGMAGVLDLGLITVAVALASFAWVFRMVGEAMAHHDLTATYDAHLTAAEVDFLTASDPDEVDVIMDRALENLRTNVPEAAGGLLDVPDVPVSPREAGEDAPTSANRLVDLSGRLGRLETNARLVRQRIESQARYRQLAEDSRDGIYLRQMQPSDELTYVNPAAREMIPLVASSPHAAVMVDIGMVHLEDHTTVRAALGGAGILARPVRIRLVGRGGEERWVEVQEVPSVAVGGEVLAVQGTIRDVTAQHRQEAALRAALEQEAEAADALRQLDELRATFLAAVSHELRTPLTALLGASQTLSQRREVLPPELATRLADIAARQGARLEGLLDDLLDVERLSRGLIVAERERTNLLELVGGIVEESELGGRHVEVTGQGVLLDVDPAQIERIVDNLLRNAAKHTPSGTAIRVRVDEHVDGAVLVVEDDGPGVPLHLRGQVFEAFSQGPDAAKAASPGTGIGLSLVQKFAELHGGSARVESSASGGARFAIFLPRVEALNSNLATPSPAGQAS